MKSIICDFCKKPVDDENIKFKIGDEKYRIDISVLTIGYGVRYKRTDACSSCVLKFALDIGKQLKPIKEI